MRHASPGSSVGQGSRIAQLLSAVGTALTVACAIVVTALLIKQEFGQPPEPPVVGGFQQQSDWPAYAVGRRIGPDDASVTITTFMDYQCAACRVLEHWLRDVRGRDDIRVAVVHRHFPLSKHPYALDAAIASECASAQGRFATMHDVLFEQQDSLGALPWSELAARAGVEQIGRFEDCLSDTVPHSALRRDAAAAQRAGVRATPTVFINDIRFAGAPPRAVLDSLLTAASAHRTRTSRVQRATNGVKAAPR